MNEGITDIQWFYAGRSREMIAVLAHGNFLVMPSFSGRVEHVQTGGLYMEQVKVADTGNYTIEVSGHDTAGAFFTLRHTALVRVGDSLMTTDGNLHVTKEVKAGWDNSDQQFHVVLSCGTFTYLTYPPFEVEWTHPDGSKENSTFYTDGKFQLLLTNPVKGGNYTCRIPQHSAATACLPENTPKPVEADLSIDSMEGRLTVLETQQTALQAENGRLKGDLKAEVASLEYQLQKFVNDTRERRVSFHARKSGSGSSSSENPVRLSDVVSNQGNAFNSSTSEFTTPVNGTYFFAAATWFSGYGFSSDVRHRTATVDIVADGSMICRIEFSVEGDASSCQCIVSLYAGQNVWLTYTESSTSYSPVTAFTGFLLS